MRLRGNMEIKVGIRVKVLVSPSPARVYCSQERSFSSVFFFPVFCCLLFLFSSLFLSLLPRFSFYFDLVGTYTAVGDHLDNLLFLFLFFFRPNCCFNLFSRSGNNLWPGYPSSGRYFCNVLTDNRFSFCFNRLSELAVFHGRKTAYICTQFFFPYSSFHLFFVLSYGCEISKTSMVVQWPDNGDYPP